MTYILMYFCQMPGHGATLPNLPFPPVYLLLQTTQGRAKSCQAVVCSLAQRQSGYQLVSGPRPHRVQGMAGSQSGPISSLSKWNVSASPFWARSKTGGLYCIVW
jgi:hypothetical protein